MKSKKSAIPELVRLCCSVLDEKKAGDLEILDVSEQSSITDYLVIATATSEPHLRALRMELEKALDANRIHLVGTDTGPESGWMVIDAFDVMIHLFLAEARERYGLERLWRDAVEVSLSKVLGGPERPLRVKKARPTAVAKPRRKRKAD
jgi:ribosome-associated protein